MLWLDVQSTLQAVPSRDSTGAIISGLAAGAFGLAGTLVTIAVGWVRERDKTATRLRQLEVASKRVSFWESWHNGILPLDSGNDGSFWKERARTQTWLASCTVEELFQDIPSQSAAIESKKHFERQRQALSRLNRWLLLYAPPRPLAWIPRILFYAYVFIAPVTIIQRIDAARKSYQEDILAYTKIRNDNGGIMGASAERMLQYSQENRRNLMYWEGGAITISIGLGLLFRLWSIRLEKPGVRVSPI